MELPRNVGGMDRVVRGVLGCLLLGGGLAAAVVGAPTLALVGAVAGIALLFNAVTQFCGVNAVLGVDTCSSEARSTS